VTDGDAPFVGVTVGVIVGVTEGVVPTDAVGVGVIVGVTDGVGEGVTGGTTAQLTPPIFTLFLIPTTI
jgi:hypothetical protein